MRTAAEGDALHADGGGSDEILAEIDEADGGFDGPFLISGDAIEADGFDRSQAGDHEFLEPRRAGDVAPGQFGHGFDAAGGKVLVEMVEEGEVERHASAEVDGFARFASGLDGVGGLPVGVEDQNSP